MKTHREPVALEGFPFIIPLLILTACGVFTGRFLLFIIPLTATLLTILFFRNPERKIPEGEGIFVSPADGRVILIQREEEAIKVSIFLSIFNVHINRMPCSGRIVDIRYKKGSFLPAFKEKASEENENVAIVISSGFHNILVKQIAGVIARRVVCWASVGDYLEIGERYGLIRFGSRIDIFLPPDIELKVKIGDKVKGGETIIGVLR